MADFLQRLAFLVFTALASHAQAQSATTSSIASNATIAPGSNSFNYLGCYNETTGIADAGNVRALGEKGNVTANNGMTVQQCLSSCDKQYAGLEFSTECWCAISLNVNAAKLPDQSCNLPCAGNSSTVCGGPLMLSVYQKQKTGPNAAGKIEIGWGIAVAIVLGLLIAVILMA